MTFRFFGSSLWLFLASDESGRGVEGGVSPLAEVDALEDAALAGDARVDVVVGQDHGVHLTSGGN